MQSSGLWTVNFFPNHPGLSNSDFPIPNWCLKSLGFLSRKGIYRGDWLHDGPAIAALFQPVKSMSFTATEEGLSTSSGTLKKFRHLDSLSIRFYPDDTGPVKSESMQSFFAELADMKNLRSLTLTGFPDREIGTVDQFGEKTKIHNLDISFSGKQLDNLEWVDSFSSLRNLKISMNDNEFKEHWGWLAAFHQLKTFSLSIPYEVDVEEIRAQLPDRCAFSLNGVPFNGEIWPGL